MIAAGAVLGREVGGRKYKCERSYINSDFFEQSACHESILIFRGLFRFLVLSLDDSPALAFSEVLEYLSGISLSNSPIQQPLVYRIVLILDLLLLG